MLIIGAGISGIGAAYRIHEKNPQLSYTILERRQRLGGTWDLFRYPGIRSDSDIYTLCFPWEPWTRPEMIVDGEHIWEYLDRDRAQARHRQAHPVQHLCPVGDWDSATDTWTVQTEQDGTPKTYRRRFVFFGTGYYNYDEPYAPDVSRYRDVRGRSGASAALAGVFDYAGKRIVVIGSGATAVSLIPSLTERRRT